MSYDRLVNFLTKLFIPNGFPENKDAMQYWGQVGDFFGGFWGTVLGAATVVFVWLTWRTSKRIDSRSKTYQVFAEILRTHEEIVTSLRLGNLSGREAISVMLSEFYGAYGKIQEIEEKHGITIAIDRKIDAAFLLMFYGAHPSTEKLLAEAAPQLAEKNLCQTISEKRRSNMRKDIISKLTEKFGENADDRQEWKDRRRDCYEILRTIDEKHVVHVLRDFLEQAKHVSHRRIDKNEVFTFIEEYSVSTEFGGHQNRLSHYFRNLHAAFLFIDEQDLSKDEKDSLAKVLRSKLSNYEQALLALNSLSIQGTSWITRDLMNRYMPIRNIPQHFFEFDSQFQLKDFFPNILFEWENQ